MKLPPHTAPSNPVEDILQLKQDAIDKHLAYGLLEVTDDYARLSKAGRFLSNAVIRDLI